MYEVNEYTLEFMPLLKQQLKLFVGINYEESAEYSNHFLAMEYHYLNNNNLLNYLNKAEYLTSPARLQIEYGA